MAQCCNNYTRSTLLNQAAAQAGQGLPYIETGQPLPAGTGLSRRSFLLRSGGLALTVYGAASASGVDILEAGIAEAAEAGPANIIVSLFLPGGVDSLSLLAPVTDTKYNTIRPTLKLAEGQGPLLAEDPRLMWHPDARGLSTLYNEGKVSVIPAIGYAGPDQSHFTSRHYWEIGETATHSRSGWLGRYLDRVGSDTNPLQGLSLDRTLAPSLATASMPVAAIDSPAGYSFWSERVWGNVQEQMIKTMGELGDPASAADEPELAKARAVARDSSRLRQQLSIFTTENGQPNYQSPVTYPAGNRLGQRFAGLAAMIAAGLPLRAVTLSSDGGFDTHSAQLQDFAPLIRRTFDALLAFQRDLEARGLADRVLVQVWSEFGRRPQENSGGTDHGAAGSAFIVGSRARGAMVGEYPGLTTLDSQGNLRSTSDFRSIYSSLLEQWLATDAGLVIPGASNFPRYSLLKS